jgi:hypothetical protein
MPKVTVYKVRHFDINTNEASIIPRLVTRKGAKTMGETGSRSSKARALRSTHRS